MTSQPPTLYLLCGLSFAGKSTLARGLSGPLGATLVEADRYIAQIEAQLPGASKIESWRAIQKLARGAARDLLSAGSSVLYDDLMVDPRDREEMARIAQECRAAILEIFLDTPVEEVRARQRRASSKPEKHARWEAHTQLLLSQLVPPDRTRAVYVAPGYDLARVLEEIRERRG